MAYDAKAVANSFLELAGQSGTGLTPMKLQKLVFFAHGWNLALFDEPLIADPIEAWKFGPVVPSLYHEFKQYRSGVIASKATALDLEKFEITEPKIPAHDSRTPALLAQVWNSYGRLSAVQLSSLTHLPDTPWAKALGANPDSRGVVITDAMILPYFKAELERNRAQRNQGH